MRSRRLSLARPALLAALVVSSAALALRGGPARGQSAEELIPFEKLDVDLRNELWKVTQRYTVRRKIEETRVDCSVDTYEWLLQRLPLSSVAAREMDLGKYVIEDKGAGKFSIDDREGAFAACDMVVSEKGRVVVVARGFVEGALLPRTKGTGVIVVRYKADPADPKRTLTDAFIFFRVASDSLHLVTAPFRETIGKIVGAKMDGLVTCASKVSTEIEKDPEKVEKALVHSKKVPDEKLEEYRRRFRLQ